MHTDVDAPQMISIGPRSAIGRHCLLDGRGGLTIGADVNISSYSRLITGSHDVADDGFEAGFAPIIVGDHAWLATGVTVLGGTSIGEGSVVQAGAVVTRDIPSWTIAGGVPARVTGERTPDLQYRLGYRPDWR
jgi:maltose O-acetyltransferase